MSQSKKRILIIDEDGFSRICSAILEYEGFGAETIMDVSDLCSRLNNEEFGLAITSYPYGVSMIEEIKKRNIPMIILSDQIDGGLINILEYLNNSYCMIKPLNYQRFKSVVRSVMDGDLDINGGYNII